MTCEMWIISHNQAVKLKKKKERTFSIAKLENKKIWPFVAQVTYQEVSFYFGSQRDRWIIME